MINPLNFCRILCVMVLAGSWVDAIAQSHYDYWPLLPNILLKFEGVELEYEGPIDFSSIAGECNHVFSLADRNGNLLVSGFSDLLLGRTGDTLHVIPDEDDQTKCRAWGSVLLLPILDGSDTLSFSLIYPRERDDLLRTFYSKNIVINEIGRLLVDSPAALGTQITSFPSAGQSLAIRHGNGRDWWILLLECAEDPYFFKVDQRWQSFLLTPDSLFAHGPTLTHPSPISIAEVAASRQGNQIAVAAGNCAVRFSFDRCGGSFGLVDTLVSDASSLSACAFSPDGEKLYIANRKRSLFVLDLAESDPALDTVFTGNGILGYETTSLELGPDDRLYWGYEEDVPASSVDPSRYLMRLENPNSDFHDLILDTFAVFLGGFQNLSNALPNFPNYELGPLVGSPCDTLFGDTVSTVTEPTPERAWTVTPTLSPEAFTIRGAKRPLQWEAYRMTGGLQAAGTGNRIAATPWPSGVYIVRLTDGTREQRVKVMVP